MKAVFWISLALIFYVYFGYPLILALIALTAKKKEYHMVELPVVSLIIAAYNEEGVISKKLKNSLALNYPPEKLEIIVAADGSEDQTVEIIKSFKKHGVILSFIPQRQGKTAAISRAAELAAGEILVFSDANNFYEEITFKKLIQPFANKIIGGTTGSKGIYDDNDQLSSSEGMYWKYESWIKKNESRFNICTAVAGETFAMRKSLFKTMPAEIINDDFYLMLSILKQGYKVVYVPEAKSWERVSASELDEIKRRKRIVAGRYQALFNGFSWLPWKNLLAIWQITSHKFLRLFVPFFMIFAFISNTWLVLVEYKAHGAVQFFGWQSGYSILFLCQLGFYLLAGIYPLFSKDLGLKALYLPAFLVNSNYAALQGMAEYFSGRQSAVWERVNRRQND
jgi:biofilm PGA synthesis N-glycosyltransferase PgaC